MSYLPSIKRTALWSAAQADPIALRRMFISKFPRKPERLESKAERWESDLLENEIKFRHDPDRLLSEPFTKDQLIEYFALALKNESAGAQAHGAREHGGGKKFPAAKGTDKARSNSLSDCILVSHSCFIVFRVSWPTHHRKHMKWLVPRSQSCTPSATLASHTGRTSVPSGWQHIRERRSLAACPATARSPRGCNVGRSLCLRSHSYLR